MENENPNPAPTEPSAPQPVEGISYTWPAESKPTFEAFAKTAHEMGLIEEEDIGKFIAYCVDFVGARIKEKVFDKPLGYYSTPKGGNPMTLLGR